MLADHYGWSRLVPLVPLVGLLFIADSARGRASLGLIRARAQTVLEPLHTPPDRASSASTVPRDTQGGSPSRCPIGVRRGECELGDWRKPRAYLQLGGRASLGLIVHVHVHHEQRVWATHFAQGVHTFGRMM